MDDIIYILIGVAWVGYSIYASVKKSQKKNQAAPPRPVAQGSGEEIPEILRRFLSLDEPVTQYPKELQKEYTPVLSAMGSLEQIEEENASLEEIVSEIAPGRPVKPQGLNLKNKVLPEKAQDEPLFDFDLRKAVIASEILNRRYE